MAGAHVRIDNRLVHGQVTVERDSATAVDPVLGFADAAEPEGLDPRDGVEREAVVDEREVDVRRAQRRP